MYLYHYYEKTSKPFLTLSDLPLDKAEEMLNTIRAAMPDTQPAMRHPDYVKDRLRFEEILRGEFTKKGGKIQRKNPLYMTVEHSPWLSTWYRDCGIIKIPIEEFDVTTISFTYGDSHPTFSPRITDGKEYRKKLYTYEEILCVIEKYGLPQEWNDDGKFGPERYVEAQVWSNETVSKYFT